MAEKKSFEGSMKRLEEIVSLLERGESPLEEAISLFEEGTRLAGECSKLLDSAEQKVVLLQAGAEGQPVETPFDGVE